MLTNQAYITWDILLYQLIESLINSLLKKPDPLLSGVAHC